MINFFQKNKLFLILLVLLIVFFVIYNWLSWQTVPASGERIFNSPDETANYFFTKLYTEDNKLSYFEPLNAVAQNIVAPRGIRVVDFNLVPGSFLGMILFYGLIAKIFGVGIIVYLTPIISIFGFLFFYLLLSEIFEKKVAFVSSLLLLIQPAFWYYNARSMFHNILFLDFLIIGFYFLVKIFKGKDKTSLGLQKTESKGTDLVGQASYWFQDSGKWFNYFFSGLFLGLALAVRTAEVLWLLPIILLIFIINYKKISFWKLILMLTVGFLIFLPIIYYNQFLYGSFSQSGYLALSSVSGNVTGVWNQVSKLANYLLPFGFHPRQLLINFWHYGVLIFWWLTIFAVAGFVSFIFSKKTKSQKLYLLLLILSSLFLILLYGSWQIQDTIGPEKITIGTSFVRYWLPIYVFCLPLVALALIWLIGILETGFPIGNPVSKKAAIIVLGSVFLVLSFQITVFGTPESLAKVADRISEYYFKRDKVEELISPTSVIIADRTDKIFFPEFAVIFQLDKNTIAVLPDLLKAAPVYYYTYWGSEDLGQIQEQLLENKLELKEGIQVFGRERLFEIAKISRDKTR